MRRYFVVKTKCGHVGKNMYIPMNLAVCAENARMAASIARQLPGVKHDHPDAILSVREVDREEYKLAKYASKNDIYFHKENTCTKSNLALFLSRIEPETQAYFDHQLSIYYRIGRKSKKTSTRMYRYNRIRQYERSLHDEIIREYGISV